MQISVVKIGNSRGIRFSKMLLEKYNVTDKVDLIMENDQIIIRPLPKPRENWEQAFKEMSDNKDDRILFDDVFEDENLEEWK